MSEFNCSYQKALTLYVPPSPPPRSSGPLPEHINTTKEVNQVSYNDFSKPSTSYAQVTATQTRDQNTTATKNANQNKKKRRKKKKKLHIGLDNEDFMEVTVTETESESEGPPDISRRVESNTGTRSGEKPEQIGCKEYFKDLLVRLKTVKFESKSEETLESRIRGVFASIIQWFMDIFKDVVTKIPIIKDLIPLLSHNG